MERINPFPDNLSHQDISAPGAVGTMAGPGKRGMSREREIQYIVNAMTNHERNLWARAGYPKDEANFAIYAAKAMERRTAELLS